MTGETVAHPVQPGSPANADVHRDPLAAESSENAPPAAPEPRRRPAKKAAAKKKGTAAKS